jgi:RimJ/RimL family protein N-acetyltransferase
MQDDFYDSVVSNRSSSGRFWGIWAGDRFIGCGGYHPIQWENRLGEISLIFDPEQRGFGYGGQAMSLLLAKAFNELNLQTVCGECYDCNHAIDFWIKIVEQYNAYQTTLVKRKYYDGRYWDSLYFSIDKDDYVQSIVH